MANHTGRPGYCAPCGGACNEDADFPPEQFRSMEKAMAGDKTYELKEQMAPALTGKKDDSGKHRFDLIPPELLEGVADILTMGAKKYGDRNWEGGFKWGRVYAALQRHLNSWWKGEELDPESGKSHLWHAACNIAFLIAFEQRMVGVDDRRKVIA